MNKNSKIFAAAAIVWAVMIYLNVSSSGKTFDLYYIRLEQWFALTALAFLYFAILATPLSKLFPDNAVISEYRSLQRILAAIAFCFGLVHASISFFFLLGGFEGLGFLVEKFIFAIILSTAALLTLVLLLVKYHTRLKHLIYVVGVLITVHALLLGTHFMDLSATIPKIFFAALGILIILEAARLDKYFRQKISDFPQVGLNVTLALIAVSVFGYYYFTQDSLSSGGIHAQHLATINNLQQQKRFTVSLTAPDKIEPNQDVNLKFKVYNAENGREVEEFLVTSEKLMHLIVVDSGLKYFDHLHPENDRSTFSVTTRFPKEGVYHLYTDFQPKDSSEQQIAFTIQVGNVSDPVASKPPIDQSLTKVFGDYEVTLSSEESFSADSMSIGAQVLNFNIVDAESKISVSDLQPYLGSFGHLVMLNQDTYQYIHVHPVGSLNALGGPDVQFMPAALNAKITPGIYRLFGQFQHNNQLFVADFTIRVN